MRLTRKLIFAISIMISGFSQSYAADIFDLGITTGWLGSTATGVSADGTVVIGNDQNFGNINTSKPFIWNSNTISRIQLSVAINSEFTGISADGSKAVGFIQSGQGPFSYDVPSGAINLIPATAPNGAMLAFPSGISDDGSTVTSLIYSNAGQSFAGSANYGSTLSPLASAPGQGAANASSANGSVIVGGMNFPSGGHAFSYSNGNYNDLGILSGKVSSTARSVSADGSVVVGYSYSQNGAGQSFGSESFYWTASSGMVNLGLPTANSENFAYDVSADGYIIVGKKYEGSDGDHAYIYNRSSGHYYDLQNVLVSNGVTGIGNWSRLYTANAISGNSTTGFNIVGQGLIGGQDRAFLIKGLTTLTPAPEPSTYVLAMIATGLLVTLAKRRKSRVVLSA